MTRLSHCIVHVGTHKTGTTSLQNVLAAHRAELAASGFFYPALKDSTRNHNPLAHRLATCTDDDLASVRDDLTGSPRARVRSDDEARLLLSAEEFSTRICNPHPWTGFDDGTYWDRRRDYLARLRRVLPDAAPVQVFACFREHESYAHALYATKVLSGKVDWSFPEFVRRCAPIFDYRRQVEVLQESLGPVRVASFEQLRGDLANRSFAWLGVPIRVTSTPRLRPTPPLDLIHWLARAAQSPTAADERERRASFCRDYRRAPEATGAAVESLWHSSQQQQDFLGACQPPPVEGWPPVQSTGRIANRAALDRRAAEIEAEYGQWRQRYGGRRKQWFYFWRRA